MVTNSVRLGVFRDRPVFETAPFGEVVVPAHIAAYAGDGLWGFLQGIASTPERRSALFRYDPMTYLLYIPRQYWLVETAQDGLGDDDPVLPSRIRPALSAMLEAYELLEPAVTGSVAEARREFVRSGPKYCLAFQRRGSDAGSDSTIAKYARLLGRPVEGALIPSRLVAPYVALTGWNGPAFSDQEELNNGSLAQRQAGEHLWATIAFRSPESLREMPRQARARLQVDSFDGVALWVGGLDEYEATVATLMSYRRLIREIQKPITLMFGGYFSLLLAFDGVTDVSHGIYYTESKLVSGAVGSGPAPDRYYVPALHRFFEPSRAFAMIRELPEFACDCPHCGELNDLELALAAASRDRSLRIAWTQRLQRHFLHIRASEAASIAQTPDVAVHLEALRSVVQRVDSLTGARASFIRPAVDHLRLWIGALG